MTTQLGSFEPIRTSTRRRLHICVLSRLTLGLAVAGGVVLMAVPSALADVPAPANTTPPVISGAIANVGDVLTVTDGVWTNSPTSFAYQWYRCDAALTSCGAVVGATASTYTIVAPDLGGHLYATVTATNAGGSTTQTSQFSTGLVGAPSSTGAPQIDGVRDLAPYEPLALVGNTVTVSDGTWAGSPTITRQWYRCDSPQTAREFDDCVAIDGATDPSYTLSDDDLGHTIQVVVTATTNGVSTTAVGATALTPDGLTGSVGAPNPAAQDASLDVNGTTCDVGPTCTVQVGQTVTTHPGTWDAEGGSGSIDFTYAWSRCGDTSCVDIPGATGPTYTATDDDVGSILNVRITGSNTYGANGIHLVAATGAIEAAAVDSAPTETSPPQLDGVQELGPSEPLALLGNTITVSDGTWTGSPTITYQWNRCDSPTSFAAREFNDCVAIGGATAASYTLSDDDLGHTIQVVVTATNDAGSASDFGHSTVAAGLVGTVGAPNPVSLDPQDGPSISGTPQVGQVLTVDNGEWTGEPSGFEYFWFHCDDTECDQVTDQTTDSTYTPAAADVGKTIQVEVIGTNAYGSNGWHAVVNNGTAIAAAPQSGGSSGGGSSGSTSSGNGTSGGSTSTAPTAPTAPTSGQSTGSPGSFGSVSIGSGAAGISASWQAQSFSAPVTVTLAQTPAGTGSAFAAGNAVTLTVKAADGSAVTSFGAPLELVFPNAPADVVPAYSPDGTTWVAIPQLASPTLPAGFHDGWYRAADSSIHILTLHATYFGLLTGVASAKAAFSATVAYPRSVNARKTHTLTVTVSPTLPGTVVVVLRKGSTAVAKATAHVQAGTHRVSLALPKRLPVGTYTLTTVLTAGREHSNHFGAIKVVARS